MIDWHLVAYQGEIYRYNVATYEDTYWSRFLAPWIN